MQNQEMLIYLADDHEIVAQGVSKILNSIDLVGCVRVFSNGKDLYKALLSNKPDIVFLDIEMPEWDGIKSLEEIRTNFPEVPCLMLSMLDEKSIIEECLKKGAKGYLHKDSKAEELKTAIENAINGRTFLSNEAQKIVDGKRRSITSDSLELLEPITERELEILKLICDGLTSREIGDLLYVSHRTVETHKNNLMQKFGVNTTGKLISLSIKNKLVR